LFSYLIPILEFFFFFVFQLHQLSSIS
jgi:hypothetical protein